MRTEGMARSPCSGGVCVRTARTRRRGQAHTSLPTAQESGSIKDSRPPPAQGPPPAPPSPRVWGPPRGFPSAPSSPQSRRHLYPEAGGFQCPLPSPSGSAAFYFAKAALAALLPGSGAGWAGRQSTPPSHAPCAPCVGTWCPPWSPPGRGTAQPRVGPSSMSPTPVPVPTGPQRSPASPAAPAWCRAVTD